MAAQDHLRYGMVELWRPRPEWYAMPQKEKERFVEGIRENLENLDKLGIRLLSIWSTRGFTDWDGMAFFEAPDMEAIAAISHGSESFDWYHHFEGNNIAGEFQSTEDWAQHVLKMGPHNIGPKRK